MTPFTHLFISKSRKVNFELSLIIRDLVNVPLVSGYYYVNWKLKNASHTSGSTERVHIKDHQVTWNHPINTLVQLVINKQQILGGCDLKLEIYKKGDKEELGSLTINLSEYAGSGVTTERYLLQNCKFNSTIKLSLRMNVKADSVNNNAIIPLFQTPPLSRQQIFKDIPTIVHQRLERSKKSSSNTTNNEEINSRTITSNSSKKSPLPPPLLLHTVRKSQSVISLPNYCRLQNSSFEEPSPIDFVEQLFAAKPNSLRVQS